MKFPAIIKGERLTLVSLLPTIKNARIVYKVIQRNRKIFEPRLDRVYNINSTYDELKFLIKKRFSNEIEYGIYIEGEFVGCVGLFEIDNKSERAELGIWIDKNYTGKGYITEAIRCILDNMKYKRIEAKVDVRNEKSKSVFKRCGFKLEGTIKKYRYSPYIKRNRTMNIYSIVV